MHVGVQDANALRQALDEALKGGAVWVTDALTRGLLVREGAFLVPALRLVDVVLRIGPLRRLVLRRMALDDPSRRA
jgi:hypothetical protein